MCRQAGGRYGLLTSAHSIGDKRAWSSQASIIRVPHYRRLLYVCWTVRAGAPSGCPGRYSGITWLPRLVAGECADRVHPRSGCFTGRNDVAPPVAPNLSGRLSRPHASAPTVATFPENCQHRVESSPAGLNLGPSDFQELPVHPGHRRSERPRLHRARRPRRASAIVGGASVTLCT